MLISPVMTNLLKANAIILTMDTQLKLMWAEASVYKPCDVCQKQCGAGIVCACKQCHRVYHKECESYIHRNDRPLDCECKELYTITDGHNNACILGKCSREPNCRQTRFWTCNPCFYKIQTEIVSFLLHNGEKKLKLNRFIAMFLRSVKSPVQTQGLDEANIANKAINACMAEALNSDAFALIKYEHRHCQNSHLTIAHVFTLAINEMRESGSIYTMPFQQKCFVALSLFTPNECREFNREFKLYLRKLCTAAISQVQFLPHKKIRYISAHQISSKESLMSHLQKRAFRGISRHSILSEYNGAAYDLHALEVANLIWVSGDRGMVYDKKCFAEKIDGLAAIWQARENQTGLMKAK